MIKFCYLRRNEFEQYANSLFSILCDNMSQIVPTGNSPEEDYELWLHSQKEEINKGKHHIIVIFQKETQENEVPAIKLVRSKRNHQIKKRQKVRAF